jgi:hypothetical protein
MMRRSLASAVLASLPFLLPQAAVGQESLIKAANRFVPGVNWRQSSVVLADFTCVGHKQQAILGTNSTDIVVAVFINGTGARPEMLRYSAKIRSPADATLKPRAWTTIPPKIPVTNFLVSGGQNPVWG